MESIPGANLMNYVSTLDDPRKASNGTLHDFREILVIAICAMLSDADNVEDIALWGRLKESWLRRFLVLKNGVPSHDTFERVFRILDPKRFEEMFRQWVGGIVTALGGQLAIDGKTLRGSVDGDEPPVHMVSAFATDLGLVLGQEKVAGKSNEITAIPVLLDALYLKGFLVSIDAMGCQKNIAAKIVAKGGDYLLAVKGNQPKLLERIETVFTDRRDGLVPHEHAEKSHGRVVVQMARTASAKDVVDTRAWPKCNTICLVDSIRVVGGKPSELEQRYYISSRELSAEELAMAVRAHWGIENRLHWMLDVNFGEDACMVRKDNAPQNLSLLKKIVLNLIRSDTTDKPKASLRQKRKRAAWDDDIRMNMLGLTPL
jgi:predicted transposase YbfD/YdcC